MEELNYKVRCQNLSFSESNSDYEFQRLVPGTRLLTRIHTVLPLHLILSLPNNLLAHVPITEISSSLTALLAAEEDAMSISDGHDEDEDHTSAPDLATLFVPGQYFPAKVLNLYPTASQSFISQYPSSETNRLAARVEMTLIPDKVNSEVAKAELGKGYLLVGEVRSEEDKGLRIGLGLNADEGMAGIEGWVSKEEVEKSLSGESFAPSPLTSDRTEAILPIVGKALVVGQLVPATISSLSAGGRVVNLSLDSQTLTRSLVSEASTVGSILPGHLVSALVTAVVSSGLNVKICGFFDGTIDIAHLGLAGADIDEKFKVGKKVSHCYRRPEEAEQRQIRARIIYDNLAITPRRFALSVVPHVLAFSSPTMADGEKTLEEGISIGKLLSSVTVSRVIPEWGVICRIDDGLEGFVHVSSVVQYAQVTTDTRHSDQPHLR